MNYSIIIEMERLIDFLTSKTGILAAIATIVSIIGGTLGILRPWIKNKKDKKANIPQLELADMNTKGPPPFSEAGEVSFSIINTSGGKAVMTDMWLHVTANGQCNEVKQVEAAAPVPLYTFKVQLNPDVKKYNVRQKKFGPKPEPHSFEKDEIEAYVIELTSSEPQWYNFLLEIEWYITSKPEQRNSLKSEVLYMEFLPEKL
jgi:hypothetical protein